MIATLFKAWSGNAILLTPKTFRLKRIKKAEAGCPASAFKIHSPINNWQSTIQLIPAL
jgi:hypothetical protein